MVTDISLLLSFSFVFLQLYHSPFFGDENNKPLLLPNEVGKELCKSLIFLTSSLSWNADDNYKYPAQVLQFKGVSYQQCHRWEISALGLWRGLFKAGRMLGWFGWEAPPRLLRWGLCFGCRRLRGRCSSWIRSHPMTHTRLQCSTLGRAR